MDKVDLKWFIVYTDLKIEGTMKKFWLFLVTLIAFSGVMQGEVFKKKLLVLIIASDNHPAFLELQEIWKSYMNLYPESITAYFIKGDPLLDEPYRKSGNVLYTKTQDNYKPGILKKTILSLEAMGKELDQYDFILRTNLSSVYDFPKVMKFLEAMPSERCYAARPLLPSYEVPSEYSKIPFGWGAGFFISPDLAHLIINEKEKLFARINEIPDDVLIGALFYEHKLNIIPVPFMTFTTRAEWNAQKDALADHVFHYRAKSHYLTRTLKDFYDDELYIAQELAQKFYPGIEGKKEFHTSYPLDIALGTVYEYHAAYPSQINDYLPYVNGLARECSSCCEVGGADMVWTWALLQGLSFGQKDARTYVGIFDKMPPAESLLLAHKLATDNDIEFSLKKEIPPCDLLFLNNPAQLNEVATAHKYIVIHSNLPICHPGWKLKNGAPHGLIVLEK